MLLLINISTATYFRPQRCAIIEHKYAWDTPLGREVLLRYHYKYILCTSLLY